ncbi:MAG: LytTR family transcriptional regulator DNA-binding domain-containing protein [Bacteroidetes bacterium]|nr:LytTR family transcriptional regulator DNA-binding domain-containing protein [Bacteroidota bacterium]
MKRTFKIALLEDNNRLLERLSGYILKLQNIELVVKSRNSDDFFEQLKTSSPDILVTDLDLGNDSMTGMEVAQELKIPVFFASVNTAEYVENMEYLKRDTEICIDHITKPFTEEQFEKSFIRFLKEVEFFSNLQYVYLDFNKTKRNKILIDDIVFLSSDKQLGSESNNKQIHFINKSSEVLIDFSFSKMEEKGLLSSQFLTIHKSFRVNKNYITRYHSKTQEIEVKVFDKQQNIKDVKLAVSEKYQNGIKKLIS